MSNPIGLKSRTYRLLKVDANGVENIISQVVDIPQLRGTDVLVKIHAVSLQYRNIMIPAGTYPGPFKADLMPCSDAAGEIISFGDAVKDLNIGDRVCANFFLDHLDGDTDEKIPLTALGGPIDGVLTEYKVFPAHRYSRWSEYRIISHTMKGLLYRARL